MIAQHETIHSSNGRSFRIASAIPADVPELHALIAGLADAITHALSDLGGGRATVVKDPVFAGSDGSLAIAQDASSSDWEKLSL